MYHNEIKEMIKKVVKGHIDKCEIMEYLINNFDWDKIYDSDDEMIREAFCALEFYASGEQEVSKGEWRYFLECLEGKREYSAEERTSRYKRKLNFLAPYVNEESKRKERIKEDIKNLFIPIGEMIIIFVFLMFLGIIGLLTFGRFSIPGAAAAGSCAHRIERIIDAALDLIDDIRKK